MPSSIAQKRWIPLILISGIAAVSLLQSWAVSRSPAPESDYRQSLQLLFDTTNSTLRSLEYKPLHPHTPTPPHPFPSHLN